jgi:hypothetical protein
VLKYKTILEFSRPEFVSDLRASRSEDQGLLNVSLNVTKTDHEVNIELSGFDGLAQAAGHLLESERAVISKEINSGKEFGSIRIECWVNECYFEYWCDAAR